MKNISLFILIILFSGCSLNKFSLEKRLNNLETLNTKYEKKDIQSNGFLIRTYFKIIDETKPLKIFIEGDGLAWLSRNTISNNPTPIKPMGLILANQFNNDNILYIARPCQYNITNKCNSKYWTSHKFSKEIINSINNAIHSFKNNTKIKNVELYGFSGGGAIATILTAKRNDVVSLNTIAGNLDTTLVEDYHKVTSFKHINQNPKDFCHLIDLNVKQTHYVGLKDKIIPINIFNSYNETCNRNMQLIELQENTHTKGWENIFK